MGGTKLTELFPLPYAHWYAATLFAEAGYAASQIFERLNIDPARWQRFQERYSQLHYANTNWVAAAFRRDGLPEPEQDRALFQRLTGNDGIGLSVTEPFSMRTELAALRRAVEANPRIGPFANVDWVAHYIGERRFPTIRYIHNGHQVYVDGAPIRDRKGVPLSGVDPFTFRQLGDRWFCDDRHVYGQGETPTKLFWFSARGADPDSFTVLNQRYGVDKAAGYYITNLRLPTEEPGTFGIVSYYYGSGQKPGIRIEESHYAKDSRKVYAYGVAIEGADAASFHSIGDEGRYFADRKHVYWEKSLIPDADRESFVCASEAGQYRAYARDAKGLIVEGVRKRGIDNPAAVESLGFSFARMGDTLLYRGKPISRPGKVNPATARGVNDQLLIDANGEMLFGGSYRKKIPGIDPAILHFLNRVFAVDARHVYAMTDTGLLLIEDIEPGEVELAGLYAVRVGDTQLHVSGGIVRRLRPEDTSG